MRPRRLLALIYRALNLHEDAAPRWVVSGAATAFETLIDAARSGGAPTHCHEIDGFGPRYPDPGTRPRGPEMMPAPHVRGFTGVRPDWRRRGAAFPRRDFRLP